MQLSSVEVIDVAVQADQSSAKLCSQGSCDNADMAPSLRLVGEGQGSTDGGACS